ncbi:MAG TPA: hypothetical protein VJT73_05830 [Polyangiaceae bacterium]|nr:hypothetical protein [Polyangiaceae bacterium]
MRAALVALVGIGLGACGTRYAVATYEEPTVVDAGGEEFVADAIVADAVVADIVGADSTAPIDAPPCGKTLRERLTLKRIDVDADIRYKRGGYNDIPADERIALAVQPSGAVQIAWLDNKGDTVHVTPLDENLARVGPDVQVPGSRVMGLVAHDDGFALLTSRADPGDPIGDIYTGPAAEATFLLRVRGGVEAFAVPLTGTKNITHDSDSLKRDCVLATNAHGRLAWNGSKYGAYFSIHGCSGHLAEHSDGDKLVYVDPNSAWLPGGFTWRCSRTSSVDLIAEADNFTSFCLSERYPFPGLNATYIDQTSRQLTTRQVARELTYNGYVGGQFGGAIKLADGRYMIGWATRGTQVNSLTGAVEAEWPTHAIGFARLTSSYGAISPIRLFMSSPPDSADHLSIHVAPYGPSLILATWDSIENPTCRQGTCFGHYGGTHFQLADLEGRLSDSERPDEVLDAPPNGSDGISVLPNGDLAWAFVAEDRSYSAPVTRNANGVPIAAASRQITVARLALCP